jgi:nucleotide-binding universal stress UspA family protein
MRPDPIGQRYHHRRLDFGQTGPSGGVKNGPTPSTREAGGDMYKHILIPTDGSELSEKAVKEGIDLAISMKAKVTVFTASPPFPAVSAQAQIGPGSIALYTASAEERAAARLKPGLDYALARGVTARTRHVFAERPYEAIIAAAAKEGCDLVCMASHGRKGIAGLLVGSETNKVLTHSKVPVLVCR